MGQCLGHLVRNIPILRSCQLRCGNLPAVIVRSMRTNLQIFRRGRLQHMMVLVNRPFALLLLALRSLRLATMWSLLESHCFTDTAKLLLYRLCTQPSLI